MALEAVVFPQDPFGCAMKELLGNNGDGGGGWDFVCDGFGDQEEEKQPVATTEQYGGGGGGGGCEEKAEELAVGSRKKRRRLSTKSCKNKEEVENQRMTHIAVERNRRMLMNEYLTVLRSIMPQSYVQRGDQASIVGGAINYVKELEQLLLYLEAQQRHKLTTHPAEGTSSSIRFSDFFTFPQYSTSTQCTSTAPTTTPITTPTTSSNDINANEIIAKNHSAATNIEVTMFESHSNLKVLSRHRPNLLLKMVVDLQNLRLTTLHLNVTTVEHMVLYSFSLKVEDDCHLTAADDIATAVHHIVGNIHEEVAGVI